MVSEYGAFVYFREEEQYLIINYQGALIATTPHFDAAEAICEFFNASVRHGKGLDILALAQRKRAETESVCANHIPVQHRDGKPPWCPTCGLTANFQPPVASWAMPTQHRDGLNSGIQRNDA